VAAVVLVACWIQPLIEQFTSDGKGNLTRLAESVRGGDTETIGFGFGTRVVATVVSLPPWWFRPSLNEAFIPGWSGPSLALAVFSLIMAASALGLCAWAARRGRDRVSLWAIGTAALALVAALVTAGQDPVTVLGKVTAHTFRWLWPLAAFTFFAVVFAFGRRLARGPVRSWLPGLFALVTVVMAALNVPFADEGRGPNSGQFEYAQGAARDLGSNMGPLEGQGLLLIDDVFRGAFPDPYGGAVVVELQRRGIPFVARDPALVRQFGPTRRFTGGNAEAALLLRQGDETLQAPPGSRQVARGEGLPAADVRELERLTNQIKDYITQRGLRLNDRGQAALEAGKLPTMRRSAEQGLDVSALFASRELDVMIQSRYLVLDDEWTKRLRRYADLQHQWDQETVALFVGPPELGLTGGRGGAVTSSSS
jgi:hypothetical protein